MTVERRIIGFTRTLETDTPFDTLIEGSTSDSPPVKFFVPEEKLNFPVYESMKEHGLILLSNDAIHDSE